MARVKYYDQASQEWKYADAALNMKGKDGYTPQKGIDYFTEEDVRELTENVLDQGVLTYNEQELTEDQKAQARENIGIDQISFDKLTENLDADGFRITNLPLPQSGSEPATKEFVENFTIEGSTYVATDDGEGNVTIRPYSADEDELVFKSHIQNQNNPHNVTAAQVGARPNTWMPTAEEVKARPDTWMPTATEVGAATPEELQEAVRKAVPRNLLDNSDFRNPVNQRGQTEYKGAIYGIDRWFCTHENWMVSVEDGHIRISDNPDSTKTKMGMLKQIIPITPDIAGKVVTLVAKLKGDDVRININDQEKTEGKYGGYDGISSYVSDGEEYTIVTATTVLPTDAETFFVALQFKNETNFICDWMALYEGVYTKDTAPEYQPKGYSAELAECQRYYQIINNGVGSVRTNEDKILVTLPLCVSMRNAISVASAKIATVRANGLRIDNPEFEITTAVAYKDYNSACVIELGGTFTGMANGIAYIDGRFHLCADFL